MQALSLALAPAPVTATPAHRQRRSRHWESPAYGLHVPTGSVAELPALARALSGILPGTAAFTHLTGAALRGWALPDRMHADVPVIADNGCPAPHLNRRGVYVRRCRMGAADVEVVGGIPVASGPQILRELAEDLALIDLVVALDSALHLGDIDSQALTTLVRPRRRGAARLSRAITLGDGRSESGWETLLRLVHMLSGLTAVEPQRLLTDPWGAPMARADLWLVGTNRLHEYDGADHLLPGQQRKDRARDNELSRSGHERRGYTRPDITVHAWRVVRDAEDAFGLPHDPRRVRGWLREFRLSSYSAAGQRAFRGRLLRFRRPAPPRSARPARVAQE